VTLVPARVHLVPLATGLVRACANNGATQENKRMTLRAVLLAVALVAVPAASVPAAALLKTEEVRAKLETPAAAAIANELSQLEARGATLEIVLLLRERVLAGALDDAAREALLDRGIHALARLPPRPASRSFVSELVNREPRVFVLADPEQGPRGVPLYDVGATAKFAQRSWQRLESREAAAAAIVRREARVVEAYAAIVSTPDVDARKAGTLEAFESASTLDLLAFRPVLVASMEAGGHADELLSLFAKRLSDADLYALLFDRAGDGTAVRAIRDVPGVLHADAAVSVLQAAMQRQELASAALLNLAELARTHAGARQLLLETLHHPVHGASAAAGLGKLHDPALAAELGRSLATATVEATRRHIALALQFDGSESARQQLQRFAQSGKGSRELRKEIAAWLAR
jgi:hypothetical protein